VSNLGGNRNEPARAAPVDVPFSPAAAPATADLFYELDNADGKLRPGEKVSVAVPLQGETESSVVPASAVLYRYSWHVGLRKHRAANLHATTGRSSFRE